jgi:hypothetical protein
MAPPKERDWERVARAMAGGYELIGLVTERFKQERSDRGMRSAADALTVIGAIASAVKLSGDPGDPEMMEQAVERLRMALTESDEEDALPTEEKPAP